MKKALGMLIGVLLIGAGFSGCSGFAPLSGLSGSSASTSSSGTGEPAVTENSVINSFPNIAVASQCTPSVLRGSSRESVRKLSKTQLLRTLQVAFPSLFNYYTYPESYYQPSYDVVADYPADVPLDPTENFNPLHLDAQVAAWADIADTFGGMVAASSTEMTRYGGDCMTAATITPACWTTFVSALGRMTYRRPLTTDEVSAIVTAVPATDNVTAVQTVVSQLLRSPYAIFHLEFGTPDPSGRVKLTQYEVAARLSYDLTDAPPDATLAAAADAGQLATLAQVTAQAQRLVTTDLARARYHEFIEDWMRMNNIGNANADVATFFNIEGAGEYTGAQAYQEILDYSDYVMFTKPGTFNDLMTSPIAFPLNQETAIPYGTAISTKGVPVSTPDHPGLLTRVGLLFNSSNQTSPIDRGVNVIRRVECTNLPDPDFATIALRTSALAAQDPTQIANWQITQTVTNTTTCMQCHSQINPIGYLFENYNVIGMTQTQDQYIFNNGSTGPQIYGSFPLPPAQSVMGIDNNPPTTYANVNQLITALGASNNAKLCMAVRFFRDFEKRPETVNDSCALSDTATLLKNNAPLTDVFVQSVANEDIFWRKAN